MRKGLALLALLASITYARPPIFNAGTIGGAGPQPNSALAASNTSLYSALCVAVQPFYAEIGTVNGMLWGQSAGNNAPIRSTVLGIDSATKWIYSYAIAVIRAAITNYTAADIAALNMTDGFINIGENSGGSSCPQSLSPRTPAQCMNTQCPGPNGPTACPGQTPPQNPPYGYYNYQVASAIGFYFYQGAHDMMHAILHTSLGNLTDTQLTVQIGKLTGSQMTFVQPLLSGGAAASAQEYADMLENMLANSYYLTQILPTTDTVCTLPGGNYAGQTVGGVLITGSTTNSQFTLGICNSLYSPIPWAWQYGLGFWEETDPTQNNDGSYSSPGSDGYYPWIDHSKTFYGVLARAGGAGQGGASAACGQLIRRAYFTGNYQPGPLPQ